jgi:polyribonucleotide nucleotidyltransferase
VKITVIYISCVANARSHIEEIVNTPKKEKIKYDVGEKHEGTVKRIVDFGALLSFQMVLMDFYTSLKSLIKELIKYLMYLVKVIKLQLKF